ncbi:preprotein translocase subunit SecY [Candidatus Uabimicrobium amorphum]|uniref:Protein translocase subunit SecY n=1 Tax=Uabimicrobium amorphum TaxID=2596890 RepID=A0A5S9F4I9_UABAM|nr:preprotein translocase subunit SecY [Candidatus Uabimicrobium amorphum]BBM85598.1 protein translocase subunit SecY [Candidatus Uabimicrobium amorphum]
MIFESFRNLFKIPELRTKILYTAFFLIIFRLGSHIPIPGIQLDVLQQMRGDGQLPGGGLGGLLTFFSALTGGSLANCAIFSLGIMPYISASIIFSLLAKVVPSLEALSKEGPAGQRKINEYTRYATVPLCIIQAIMIMKVFKSPMPIGGNQTVYLVAPDAGFLFDVSSVVALTAGGIFLMWLGEQITEYGVGNGISLLIMAGIVASIPYQVNTMLQGSEGGAEVQILGVLLALFVVIVFAIVYISFGQRKIAVQQAKHVKGHKVYGGQRHFLPLKVNQAGVMPVIFASSLLIFPQVLFSFLGGGSSSSMSWFSSGTFSYIASYIVLIYFFSYFWTSLMFQPSEMANNLKENGSFIPGIRPGKKTSEYLEKVMTHVTFVGAAFLALIALTPVFITMSLGLSNMAQVGFAYNMGGTSILIIVGVVLDLVQKLESHLLMRHYEGFTKGKRGSGNRRF